MPIPTQDGKCWCFECRRLPLEQRAPAEHKRGCRCRHCEEQREWARDERYRISRIR